jgi:DNA-directed RNA polymerase subunit M/transcription elongation factor TFIIS
MTQQFDEDGYGILRELTTGPQLKFRNEMTGAEYLADPSNTILASEETGESRDMLKHANSLRHTPFDSVNIAIEVAGGCTKCGRRAVRMQQLGEQKKAVYVCLCGYDWTN